MANTDLGRGFHTVPEEWEDAACPKCGLLSGTLAKGCFFEVFENGDNIHVDIFLFSDETKSTDVDAVFKIPTSEIGPWLVSRTDW